MAPDTNFKEQDPKRQYNTDENPKNRAGSYDSGQDFDPTEGYDNHPDDQYTADMVQEEDRYLYEAGHDYEEEDEAGAPRRGQRAAAGDEEPADDELDDDEYEDDDDDDDEDDDEDDDDYEEDYD